MALLEKKTRYVGWWRKDSRSHWRPLIYDPDDSRCFNRLLDAAPKGGDKIVLKAGDNPNNLVE